MTEKTTALFGVVDKINELLQGWGVSHSLASTLDEVISLTLLFILAWLANLFTKAVLYKIIVRFTRMTKAKWDDLLIEYNLIKHLVRVIPGIIVAVAAPIALRSPFWVVVLERSAQIFIVATLLAAIGATTRAMTAFLMSKEEYANKPIKVIFQIVAVLAYFVGGIIILSILIDRSFTSLFAALGASMAILMLIFKDSILGFVAGWQLSVNNMLRPGDWITVPKFGADGDVEEISLYSVKVRNFDKTITTVPPYALITDSFQNWRGMQESDGRRVKRSIIIDMHTVQFCTPEMLERFRKIRYIEEYVQKTEKAIEEYNEQHNIDNTILVNGRRQTNIGVFRAYLTSYLANHPMVSKTMTAMVRQLQPTEKGIPIELYFFISDKNWVNYENIQSDIFDHILAIVPQFDLQIFQFSSSFHPAALDG